MEAHNQSQKEHKSSISSVSGYYSYSYTGDYYSGSQNDSYSDASYSYSYSYSPHESNDKNQKGVNSTSLSSGLEYSYSVSEPKQDLKRIPKPTTYNYTEESTTDDEYSYSSPQQSVHKWAESPSQQKKEVPSVRKEDNETQSYSYSYDYDYSYSYSDYTPSLTGKESSTRRNGVDHVGAETSESGSSGSIRIATSRLGSSIKKNLRPTLSGGSSATESTSYPYSYSVDSLTPTRGDAADVNVDKGYSSYSSSSAGKSTPLYSYTYDSSATQSHSYSYSYTASTELSERGGQTHAQSDDYSYSVTTPYPAHTKKVSSGSSYTYADSYSGTDNGASSQTSSASILLDSKTEYSTTTTTYEVTSERDSSTSGASQTERFTQRKLIILRTPKETISDIPPPPSRCFVDPCSQEDSAHKLLRCIVEFQQMEEPRVYTEVSPPGTASLASGQQTSGGVATPSTGPLAMPDQARKAKNSKKDRKSMLGSKKETDVGQTPSERPVPLPTPKGYCTEKTARVALSVLRLNHLERREVLRDVSMPVKEGTLRDILDTCAATRVKETVAQTFLARDPSHSGELPISVVGDVLHRLGVARSPVIDRAFRINIRPIGTTGPQELFLTIETPPPGDYAADVGRWQTKTIPVCDIVRSSLTAKRPMSIRLESGSIYMGQFHICHGVPSKACFERLKTYLEAATYACVLVHFFSYEDDITREVKVQYPKLVRSLLASSEMKGKKSIFLDNLFRELYDIDQQVVDFASGRGILTQYAGKNLVESTLYGTQDVVEKRRRNVIPNTSEDQLGFQTTPKGTDEEVRLSFSVRKVRISNALPDDTRCYCLISAITYDDVFLPAVEVPVRKVCASTKGGFTWAFDKDEKSEILFVGPRTDRIYIECCYEVKQKQLGDGLPAKGDSTVWCAGYTILPVAYLRETATWPVVEGSLLDTTKEGNTPTPVVGNIATVPPPRRTGLFACLGLGGRGGSRKVLATQPAVEIKVKVLKQEPKASALPLPFEDMPARYIIFRRHAKLISLLRSAIHHIGKLCRHASQVLRQQISQRIFLVASSVTLMDQFIHLWNHQLKHMDVAKKKDTMHHHELLLLCVTTLAALHNCSSEDQGSFAALAIHRKPLTHAFDANAPQCPISV
ncbi:unnamed protein product [Phytomonas sp. EM1]|nr:unnamed protein product [Phytomonas sp. EM1]|eukprot:CCW61934.1 unnamed protein product [Phytomonas sp. isolate EM1]